MAEDDTRREREEDADGFPPDAEDAEEEEDAAIQTEDATAHNQSSPAMGADQNHTTSTASWQLRECGESHA